METSVEKSKFGDIILWSKTKKKFIVVRNYYKLPNLLKTNSFEVCCMSLGYGSFVSLTELNGYYNWYEATAVAKVYKGSAPIKSYLPNIDELHYFYPFIEEFNNKINKLQSLGIACDKIQISFYWSSTECSSSYACYLHMYRGDVCNANKYCKIYVRAFVAF